jgi:hypothetical protein
MPPPAAAKPAPKPPAGPKTFDDMGVPVVQQKEDCVSSPSLLVILLSLPLLYILPLVEAGNEKCALLTYLPFFLSRSSCKSDNFRGILAVVGKRIGESFISVYASYFLGSKSGLFGDDAGRRKARIGGYDKTKRSDWLGWVW